MNLHTGLSLLEILLCLFLLSLLLLGIDAMHVQALRLANTNAIAQIAYQQLINMREQLNMTHTLTANALQQWNQQNASLLPKGKGEVIGACPQVKLIIYWGENSLQCNFSQLNKVGCLQVQVSC